MTEAHKAALEAYRMAETACVAAECQLDNMLVDSSATNEDRALARLAYDIASNNLEKAEAVLWEAAE